MTRLPRAVKASIPCLLHAGLSTIEKYDHAQITLGIRLQLTQLRTQWKMQFVLELQKQVWHVGRANHFEAPHTARRAACCV
jgi:hypothetical protein